MAFVDLVLLVILVVAAVAGLRRGLLATVGGLVGLGLGGAAAFVAVPVVNDALPTSEWRGPATLVLAVVLPLVGASLGAGVGHGMRRQLDRTPLRPLERLLGGVVHLLVVALVVSFVGTAVKATGAPGVVSAVSSSAVLRTIEDLTPTPVSRTLAQVRAAVLDDGLPRLDGLLLPRQAPVAPAVDLDDPALERSARSVARVWGTAYACGTGSTGSGFVVAPDRVVTNAHVVAGVERPLVELPGGAAQQGRVVYFDADADLAVVAVDGLGADPLTVAPSLATGDPAAVQGYPYGGPFTSASAEVLNVGTVRIPESGGIGGGEREIYALAAEVHPGNSGGPVLTTGGDVAGVVFARSDTEDDVAYAVTTTELMPVVAQAEELDAAVTPGSCAG